MCGIAGQFNFLRGQPADREAVMRMAGSIVHRGPDDEGFFFDGPLGLGFRRLSIIDLAGGRQPMSDQDESVWVVFNGEIYNFPELRSELEGRGHVFRTSSDTEVIVHGYKQWGDDVLKRLNGMFGLAIWDVARRRLLVARDAMGIKMVYYRLGNECLQFGSEMRALQAVETASPELDPEALRLFLQFRYTPSPLTIQKGIRKLAPGKMLLCEKGTVQEKTWYDDSPRTFDPVPSDHRASEDLLELYRDAVKRHLLSDVPVGILLSGGLDSGLLLALMREHGDEWPAFTVGYGDSFTDDELHDAAESARILGGKHIPVQITREEFESSLPGIVRCLEEPIASSSIVPMYFVCRRAREDVKVALIGQGPDELFGGYKRHLGVRYGGNWRQLPLLARKLVSSAVGLLPRNETLKRGVNSLGTKDRLERYEGVFSLAPSVRIEGLFRDGLIGVGSDRSLVPYWESLRPQMSDLDELGGFQHLEIRSSLPDELLMFGDKLSMAHSLEVRVPYLDREVVEYAQRLPSHLKVRRGTRKWLHREVCRRYLPRELLSRKKRGFAVNVVDDWFHAKIGGGLHETLTDPQSLIYQYLNPAAVRKLLEDHRSRRNDNHKLLFSIAMVEQWLRVTISDQSPDSDRNGYELSNV